VKGNQDFLGYPGMCRDIRKAEERLETHGMTLTELFRAAIQLLDMGASQEQLNRYAFDCGNGQAKPLEDYV